MQHKFLLRFIKQEMERQKIVFKNNEAFFKLFLPDEPWEAYRSNMSNWLSSSEKDGVIRKRIFIEAVNDKLGLFDDVWGTFETMQKERVLKAISVFKEEQEKEEGMFLWLENVALSGEQEQFLDEVKSLSVETIKESLEEHKDFFEKRSDNQAFLIELFHLMYERGEYVFVYETVFPALLDSYDNRVKARKADIYASLPIPMYREAFEILNSIQGESKAETLDLKTSAISNIRREYLSSNTLTKASLKKFLERLIGCYSKTYVPKEEASYYPGINLAYIIALAEQLFPNERAILANYSVKQIYKDVEKSLERAKASSNRDENYYGGISEIEFQLLLNSNGMEQTLAYFLEEHEPSVSQVRQTKRQMGLFFVEILKGFSDEVAYENFERALLILDEYLSPLSA